MQNGSFFPDDASGTGLDVYKTEHTAPPPGWSDGAQGGKEQPTVWNYYSKKAEHYDDDLIEDANNTVEVLLIFAGLFSAVVTAFISQTYPMLKPDPGDTLTAILQELQHPGSTPAVQPFNTPRYAVRVNCFLFAGLFISMIVALLSILVKQWARSYQRDLAGVSSPHLRARIRHFRYNGARRWHFTDIVGILSIFMHLALLISGIGIIDLLLSTAPTVGYVALSIFLAGMTFFIATTITPLFFLDAPFRSPLSKLMTGIHRRFAKSKPKSRKKKGDDEEGLEDHLEQSQGRESEENSIVRTQFHLDLDILSHLLGEADKSTERWLLDLCFEKLPQLSLLEKRDPDLILRRKIILEVYTFLAKGCVGINKNGEKEAEPTRLQRARKLCEFLSWFLSLRQTPDVRDFLRQVLTANNFDPRELPLALAQDDNNTASVTRAYSALGRVEHLLDKKGDGPGPGCSACFTKYGELSRTLQSTNPDVTAVQKSRVITSFLIQRTDCTLCWEKSVKGDWATNANEKFMAQFDAEVKLLQEGFKECAPTDNNKKIWDKALKDKEASGSDSMKNVWFTPLLDTLKGLQIQRGHSPIWKNSGSNMSSPASNRSPSTSPNNSRFNPRSPNISFGGSSTYTTPTPTLNVPPNNFA